MTAISAADQLVHASVAGLVVDVAAPPVAVTPVSDGIEKYVLTHAAGAAAVMLASLVSVTTNGLLAAPASADRQWGGQGMGASARRGRIVPDHIASRRRTSCLGRVQRVVVYPAAYVVLVGSCTALIVTGYGLLLAIVTTTSPLPPG